jgi:hypothetical protein
MATRRRKYKSKAIKRNRGPVAWRVDHNKKLQVQASIIFNEVPVPIAPGFDFHASVARTLTAVRKGDSAKAKMAARRAATDAKWLPLKTALEQMHVDLSTDRNFNADRIGHMKNAILRKGVKPGVSDLELEKTVKSFIRWLTRR